MKKTIISILLFSIALSKPLCVAAQTESQTEVRRECLIQVINLLEDYEYYSKLNDSESINGYLELFASPKSMVYNDLQGQSDKSAMTVEEYVNLTKQNISLAKVTLKNISKKSVTENNGQWQVVCTFDKQISYYDKSGVHLSSEDIYHTDYKLEAVFVYNPENNKCHIEKIIGSLNATPIGTTYMALQSRDKRDAQLRYNGQNIQFDGYRQALFPNGLNVKKLSYKDADVQCTPYEVKDSAHLIRVKYKARRWRIMPHYDLTIGDYYTMTTTSDNISSSCTGSEFGLDFGYTIPSQSKSKFSFNTGLGYAMSKIDLSVNALNYSYTAPSTADADGDTYNRMYELSGASERLNVGFLNIPLYADMDWCFSRYVSAYIQAGIKNYIKISANLDNYSAQDYVYGIYPKYDNLRMDEHWGYNNFGSHSYTKDDVTNSVIPVNTYSMDIFGGVGIRIKPFRRFPMALEVGIQYQTTVVSMWTADQNGLDYTNTAENTSMFSYNVNGPSATDGETIRMLNNGLSDVKRSHLKLNIGLVFKF